MQGVNSAAWHFHIPYRRVRQEVGDGLLAAGLRAFEHA